ncbi:MAG: pyruvate carboxylase, partial [Finegoldia magna]|nr:pyruvate carboxylase [Finegoldia magna]
VSELITGIDIVQTQILIADGKSFDSDEIGIYSQDDIHTNGYAIQCRITTEDPANNFMPDTGKIDLYRTSSGFGVRLDGGNGFTGSVITPYYDSLLVKITAFSRTFNDTINKAIRALRETKISGVKTNIGFIINVLNTEEFHKGTCDTGFISKNPELFDIKPSTDKELKVLNFISERSINNDKKDYNIPQIPEFTKTNSTGTKDIFEQKGAKGLSDWILNQDKLLITDTTLRDAHQSLMATRMRTRDMLPIAEATNELMKDLFSLEMWGGATFDVSYRFLKEDPWIRLQELRKRIPNILFQMLLRGNNTVGYKNYPDNVVVKFVQKAAENGIDVFRVFDSLNYIDGMRLACDSVLEQGKILEATLCYTGDILDESRDKYSLEYYVKKAKELESIGANIIAIKDMSALLKPYAATKLISALKNEISVPIHLHTHDTTGNGVATIINACESGADIVDTCFNSMSSLTSQPALNSVVAALENTPRQTGISLSNCDKISNYYKDVRSYYSQFESDLKSGTTEIYRYEIPGGQYSNLKPQVESFGLGEKFDEVKLMYKKVNDMLGDIIKV